MTVQDIIEHLIALDRFSMKSLYDSIWSVFSADGAISDSISALQNDLSNNKYKQIACGILRYSFLIELVKIPGIETTKFRTRWYSQLNRDPRECSFEECLEIAQNLILVLTNRWLKKSSSGQG